MGFFMEAIRWKHDSLYLLDQTCLPAVERWLRYTDYREVAQAIKTMVVRGAPAIGIAAAYATVLAARENCCKADFPAAMSRAKEVLAASRPTAVNLFWALNRMERCWQTFGLARLEAEALAIHSEDIQMNEAMGKAGAELVPNGARILTHCNAGALATGGYGTALGVIRAAHAQGKVSMVYADETRPLLQGARLTASCFAQAGFDTTVLTDNMTAYAMEREGISLFTSAADVIARDGHIANKTGTFQIAILAKYFGVPYYVTGIPDADKRSVQDIVIEQRDPGPVLTSWGIPNTVPEVKGVYPSFDVTPPHLISGVVTDKGVYVPYLLDRYFDGDVREFY